MICERLIKEREEKVREEYEEMMTSKLAGKYSNMKLIKPSTVYFGMLLEGVGLY